MLPQDAISGLEGLAERLKKAVDAAGGKHVVSERSNVPIRSLTGYISGRNEPPATTLSRLAKSCGVSLDWLFGEATSVPVVRDVAESKPDIVLVNLLSIVASAGNGIKNWNDQVETKVPFTRAKLRELGVNPNTVEFIKARGDSMEPTIRDGTIVLIDRAKKEIREDGIYAVSVDDEVRLKRIRKNSDGSITLISDNKEFYPEERVSTVDLDNVKVHGRVIWAEKFL